MIASTEKSYAESERLTFEYIVVDNSAEENAYEKPWTGTCYVNIGSSSTGEDYGDVEFHSHKVPQSLKKLLLETRNNLIYGGKVLWKRA